MKWIKSFKLFEASQYKEFDVVTIRYHLTGDIVPVKIIKDYGNKGFLVTFKTDGNPFFNAPDQIIRKNEIISSYSLVNDPVTFRNPMNIPNDYIRLDKTKVSNDMVINGYPKTLA